MLRWVPLVVLAACKFQETELGDAAPDSPSNINCNNDPHEPNNTRTTATAGNISSGQFSAGEVSICPEGDVDMFAVVTSFPANLEVVTVWQSGPVVSTALLDAAGMSIGNGTAFSSTSQRVCVPNLPAGTYIGMATGSGRNNYVLTIRILGDC